MKFKRIAILSSLLTLSLQMTVHAGTLQQNSYPTQITLSINTISRNEIFFRPEPLSSVIGISTDHLTKSETISENMASKLPDTLPTGIHTVSVSGNDINDENVISDNEIPEIPASDDTSESLSENDIPEEGSISDDDIEPAPEYSDNPDYASSYEQYDDHDYDFINDSDDGLEAAQVYDAGYHIGTVEDDGYISTYWYDFSPEEIFEIAQVMIHEAGNQCEAGKIGVVEVILNRMQSSYYEDTVEGVIYAPGQFSFVERSFDIVPSDEDLCLVQDVILGYKRVFNDENILYFRNPVITSGIPAYKAVDWDSHGYACYIEDHAFYYQ